MGAFDTNSGKVNEGRFKELLLDSLGATRQEVVCGPGFGVDTSVIDLGNGQGLAISSDPLSLIPALGMEVSAWLSIHLMVNDMATTGFGPQYAQFVLNLPDSLSQEHFSAYWTHIDQLCRRHGIAITGGHTGQVPGQESTISGGGTMFLQAPLNEILTSNQAEAGDVIVMTKTAALSSTSLLAMSFPATVTNQCGQETQRKASENFWQLSVLREALLAKELLTSHAELKAMHDVTEGGVLGAVYELARASGCGFEVALDAVPVTDEAQQVAALFAIDPTLCIGAGSMLLATQAGSETKLVAGLLADGLQAQVIGRLTAACTYEVLHASGATEPFHYTGEDPYWAAYFKAWTKGWR